MKSVIIASALVFVCFCSGVDADSLAPLQGGEQAKLERYAGLWYEIAHYPNRFEEGCVDSTVTFTLRKDGEFDVLNSCQDQQSSKSRHATGRGWVVDPGSHARLKVSYFWPFRTEYVIIDQGKENEYAVIGSHDRKRFWIIARTPTMNADVFDAIIAHAEKQGFQRDHVQRTVHNPSAQPEIKVHLKTQN
jgi:apolipoprotein D and lipocalin family protein